MVVAWWTTLTPSVRRRASPSSVAETREDKEVARALHRIRQCKKCKGHKEACAKQKPANEMRSARRGHPSGETRVTECPPPPRPPPTPPTSPLPVRPRQCCVMSRSPRNSWPCLASSCRAYDTAAGTSNLGPRLE
ncbi:unnamed protein product, partial [Iphiclides podalirius]